GWANERGRGTAANALRANELYTLGCTRGSARACAELARLAERRDSRDPQIFELYNQACTGAYLPGCLELGRRYDTAGYREYAFALYRTVCALHEPEACTRLAAAEEQIPGKAADAAAHYEQGCAASSVTGCTKAGLLYAAGKGVPADAARAARLFETGCNGNDFAACEELADAYSAGRGVARDLGHALALYDRACAAARGAACLQAGMLYRRAGRSELAQRRFDQGCRAGNQPACFLSR
ncbi:MAG TPA: hypothetical protein VIX73_36830, partial [Kofleriaceae bacterium]